MALGYGLDPYGTGPYGLAGDGEPTEPTGFVAAQQPGMAGAVVAFTAADAGGQVVSPNVRLLVVNSGGGAVTLTVAAAGAARGGLAVAGRAVPCPNGSFPANATAVDVPGSVYRQVDGYCRLSWSGTSGVSLAVLGQVTSS